MECAEGGHLDEMLELIGVFESHNVFFVTTKAPTTIEISKRFVVYYTRHQYQTKTISAIYLREFLLFLKILVHSFLILIKERPNLIVSTGGGSTIPLCYVGKLLFRKVIYIESLARVNTPSITGRLVHPIADLFLVQWPTLLRFYKRARFWGSLL
ncbi:MAG: PssD/Cps14F family polysaccharide biosynthesis glycosyltransferase [Candidatus Methanosuratincola petrocarbonis]